MEKFYLPFVNGVSLKSEELTSIGLVRNLCGVQSLTYKEKSKFCSTLFLRGIVNLFLFIYYYIKDFIFLTTKSREERFKVVSKMSKSLNISYRIIFVSLCFIISLFFSFLLLGYLPIFLASKIFLYNTILQRLLIALIKCLVLTLLLLTLRLYKPYKQLLRFNSALIDKFRTDNDYLRVNYFVYLFFSFLVSFFVLSLVGLTAYKVVNVLINIILFLVSISVCYEIIFFIEKKQIRIGQIILKPLYLIFYAKPSSLEKMVIDTAQSEVKLMKENKDRKTQNEIEEEKINFSYVYAYVKDELLKSGIDDSSEVDWLIAEALEKNRAEIKLLSKITNDDFNRIKVITDERKKRKPLTKIMGKTEFYGLEFKVNENVLSPRMETELLVEKVILNCGKNTKVLDIGTGSGAIAVSVAKFSEAKVSAVDISEKALEVAKENAKRNNVKVNFVLSNLFSNLKKNSKFDIIVSNPPYIESKEIELLDEEVKNYDPLISLDGGEDGLRFYREIIKKGYEYLKKDGILLFEVGESQARKVKNLMKKDYEDIQIIKDYNNIERIVIGKKGNKNVK